MEVLVAELVAVPLTVEARLSERTSTVELSQVPSEIPDCPSPIAKTAFQVVLRHN